MEAAWQYLHRRLSTQMKDLGGFAAYQALMKNGRRQSELIRHETSLSGGHSHWRRSK